MGGGSFLPTNFDWPWNGDILGTTVFSNSQSGLNVQSNGIFLICETIPGRISEIEPSGSVVWSYENPKGGSSYVQGDIIPNSDNQVFRAEKYPIDFAGFIGKDLTSTGIIEDVNTLLSPCKALAIQDVVSVEAGIVIYPNPVANFFTITSIELIKKIEVFNINGKRVKCIFCESFFERFFSRIVFYKNNF